MAAPKGNKFGKGRPLGSHNKSNVAAREAFQMAFEGMGGVEKLMLWAQKNSTEFYKLYGRLIPVDTTSGGDKIKGGSGVVTYVLPDKL